MWLADYYCYIVGSDLPPFLIGIYVGYGDPICFDEFLSPLCKDIQELTTNGIQMIEAEPIIEFQVRLYTADTSARSKLTATHANTHRSCCHKCDQHSNKICYNFFETVVRNKLTDELFSLR